MDYSAKLLNIHSGGLENRKHTVFSQGEQQVVSVYTVLAAAERMFVRHEHDHSGFSAEPLWHTQGGAGSRPRGALTRYKVNE
jgi:hypothetical protein